MNTSLVKKLLLILLFLILPVHLCAVGVLPVGKAEYDFVYDRLLRGEALSGDIYDYQLGPFDDHDDKFAFGPFAYLSAIPASKLVMFSFVGEDFYSAKTLSPAAFESLRGGVAAAPLEKLFVYGNFLLDERMARDEGYTGKKWRGLAGGVEEAFVSYRSRPFAFTVGRFASFWGPRNSLVLSSTNALDGFGYSFYWGRLVLTYRLAKLDGLNPDEDDVDQFENRFFAGHRLDIHLSRWLRVGLFESIIFGGPGRQVDLLYLNPIVFFHADQLNEGMDDNTLIGFDYVIKPRPGLKLYGQLLIDDFQIDKKTQGDQEPDQYGVILGVQMVNLLREGDLDLEYSRVTNWTFNQTLERNRYLFNKRLLGGAIGHDYETWQLTLTRWVRQHTAVSARLLYRLQGEGRVTDEWTAPWLDFEGDYEEPFPTGVVEETRSASLRLKSFAFNHFYIDAEAGVTWFGNYRHVYGDDRSIPFVRLQISSFFSVPVSVDW